MSVRIRYSCPHCQRRIVHHPELAGQLVICSACKGEFYEPTDPLPGKPAERALEPMPESPRRLRVPEGNNPKHDLALLARRDASDLRTITEIVEAVLLDDDPPVPAPQAGAAAQPRSEETIHDFGYSSQEDATSQANSARPTRQPRHSSSSLSGPPLASLAGALASPAKPHGSGSSASVAGGPPALSAIAKPAVPVPLPVGATPERPLAGVSIKQMTEEIRRRGLGVALITCDVNPLRDFELAFSDNMTRDDALAILRKYLDSLRELKPIEKPGLLKRMWNKGDRE